MKTYSLALSGMLLISSLTRAQNNNTNINITVPKDTVVAPAPATPAPKDTVVIREVPQTVAVPVASPTPQNSEPPFHGGEFGLRYMPTFTSLKLTSQDGQTVKGQFVMGYGFGALLGVSGKHVGVQLEVIYNSLSQRYSYNSVDHDVHLTYLNIPLLLTLSTDKSKPVNLNFVLGPQVGVNIGSDIKTTNSANGNDSLQGVLSVKKADFGFVYGAGLEFSLNPSRTFRLGVGFRGVYGLVDISDNSKNTTTNQYYILNRSNVETYSGYIGLSVMF